MDDIAVTKYLENVLTKFLEEDNGDISVTKFLGSSSTAFNGVAQNLATSNDVTVTKFLEEENGDISVTKFLNGDDNGDISVTKFLNEDNGDISVTKFLGYDSYCSTSAGRSDPCCSNTQHREICGPVL